MATPPPRPSASGQCRLVRSASSAHGQGAYDERWPPPRAMATIRWGLGQAADAVLYRFCASAPKYGPNMKPGSIRPRIWYRKLFTEFCSPVPAPSLKLRNHGPPLEPPVMLQDMPMSLLSRKSLI